MCIGVCVWVRASVCAYVCACVYVWACVYVHVNVHMCVLNRMMEWLKQGIEKVVPRPEIYIHVPHEGTAQSQKKGTRSGPLSSRGRP